MAAIRQVRNASGQAKEHPWFLKRGWVPCLESKADKPLLMDRMQNMGSRRKRNSQVCVLSNWKEGTGYLLKYRQMGVGGGSPQIL